MLRESQTENYEFDKDKNSLFIDFKQDFDKVKTGTLIVASRELVSNKVI